MNFQERKTRILELLDQTPSIEVREFAEILGVSEITVRRDLNLLGQKGLVYRTHGGAMNVRSATETFDFSHKVVMNAEAKDYIAQSAARFIQDGDTVFLDCGSTVYSMCPYIRSKRIKVVTNSLPVVYSLLKSEANVNLVGGELDKERLAVHGSIAAEHISRYRVSHAFIGVDGMSVAAGLSSNSEQEASMSLAMAKNANQVFLLCDSTKLENDKYLNFAPLSVVNTLITDSKVPADIVSLYKKAGLKVIN